MSPIITQCLKQLNCSKKEQEFFEACFSLGPSTVTEIASRAHLQRSTAYILADTLVEKRLLVQDHFGYKQRYSTISPKILLTRIDARDRSIRKTRIKLEAQLDDLEAVHKNTAVLPKVKVYKGKSGLLTVLNIILHSSSELLIWTNQESEQQIFDLEEHNTFVENRIKMGVSTRVLAVNNPRGTQLQANDPSQLRKTKLLPKTIHFLAETYIFDNKVAMLDFTTDVIAVVMTNPSFYLSQRAQFEHSWQSL